MASLARIKDERTWSFRSCFFKPVSSLPSALSSKALQAPLSGLSLLIDIPEGTYLGAAQYADAYSLCQLDAACRLTWGLNRSDCGPWRSLGASTFKGMELESEGDFDQAASRTCCPRFVSLPVGNGRRTNIDWKNRYRLFKADLPTFRMPFCGREISRIDNPDEVVYCQCMMRAAVLDADPAAGVYVEIEVSRNPDNLSMAVVDFEAGGHSSVTFSPDTGAVIRERKIQEVPRKVEGAYIQPLDTIAVGQCFEGSMGLYFSGGHLAFFRRQTIISDAVQGEDGGVAPSVGSTIPGNKQFGPWETTGFVTDTTWAEGNQLTPCLAFRNEGSYGVRMVCVSSKPPMLPQRNVAAYQEGGWSSLDWDATEQDELEG